MARSSFVAKTAAYGITPDAAGRNAQQMH